jgi:hypothetical protein
MWWIVAIVGLLIVFWIISLCIEYPGCLVTLLIIIVALVFGINQCAQKNAQENEKKERLSKSRIKSNELTLEGFKLKPGEYDDLVLTGRIKNNSKKYSLDGLSLKLVFQDCSVIKENSCITIGEKGVYLSLSIPPGQARDIYEKISLYGKTMIPKGKLIWHYDINYTVAK